MKNLHRLTCLICGLMTCLLGPCRALFPQDDIQQTVQQFLQAWYVDKKPASELKSYIAKDNGFNLRQLSPTGRPITEARGDPVNQLFAGAFAKVPIGAQIVPSKTLSDAIEYPPAKHPSMSRGSGQRSCLTTTEFLVCRPEQLPPGAVLPATQPSGKDPVANFLWHLSQSYKGKLYVVLYTTKGAGLLRETAILYWIQEDNSWKLAAFEGTDW